MTGSNASRRIRWVPRPFALAPGVWSAALACAVHLIASAHVALAGLNVWTTRGPGVGDAYVLALAIDPTTPSTLYAGMGGGVVKSTDGGSTWGALSTGLTNVSALAIDPTTPSTLYAATEGTKVRGGSVFKSTDGGNSWSDTALTGTIFGPVRVALGEDVPENGSKTVTLANARGVGGFPTFSVVGIVIDPTMSRTLYATTILGGVLKSTDGGGSWSAVNTGLADSSDGTPRFAFVNALVIDPAAPSTLYAAKGFGGGVFKSTDSAGGWNASGLTNTDIRAFAIDPITPDTLYVASDADVFKSTDGAGSWKAITAGLSNTSVSALVIDPNSPSTLYAGTGGGVFKSTDGAWSWHVMNAGLTNTNVEALAIDPITSSRLFAGTFGGGVFSIQQITVSPCIGDCDDISTVSIDNLLTMVNITLGTVAISECPAGDRNQDNSISVDEILAAVNNALSTCPVPSTPTPTVTPTFTPTGTKTPTPTPGPAVAALAVAQVR